MTVSLSYRAVDERIERVTDLTCAGMTAGEIAEKLGVTRRTVTRLRIRGGVSERPSSRLDADELNTARRLLDEGCSYTEVARTLGRSHSTISRHFPARGASPEQAAELRRLRYALDALDA